MKAIDGKGRLFGKINIVDLLVILVLIAVAAGVVWKLAGSRVTAAITGKQTIEYEVVCSGIDNDICDTIAASYEGKLLSNSTILDAEVTGCTVEPYMMTVVSNDGEAATVESTTKKTLRFEITANVDKDNILYTVGTQEVRVGKSHIVKTTAYEVTGNITKLTVEPSGEAANG